MYCTWQRGLVSKGVLEHTLGMHRPQYLKYDIKDIALLEQLADFPVKRSERKSSVFFKCFHFRTNPFSLV
jgi:hypothetical protein